MMLEGLFRRGGKKADITILTPEQIAEARKSIPEPERVRRERIAREEEVQRAEDEKVRRKEVYVEFVVKDLQAPIENILIQLMPQIEKGDYSAIIGDDASGRIPTMILAHVMREIYKAKGYSLPTVRFLAGSTGLHAEEKSSQESKKEALAEQVARIQQTVRKHSDTKKALIMTDIIETGESVQTLLSAVRQKGWDADIATIGTHDENAELQELSDTLKVRIIRGRWLGALLHRAGDVTGLQKDKRNVFAISDPDADPKIVRYGRELARNVAAELFRKYQTKNLGPDINVGGAKIYEPQG